jgi:16S rRNA C1402 (ribose-2'-O) methylase RsmI
MIPATVNKEHNCIGEPKQAGSQERAARVHVHCRARHQLTGFDLVVEGEAQRLHPVVEVASQVEGDVLGKTLTKVAEQVREQPSAETKQHYRSRRDQQGPTVVRADAVVDRLLQYPRRQRREQHGSGQRPEACGDTEAMKPQVSDEPREIPHQASM